MKRRVMLAALLVAALSLSGSARQAAARPAARKASPPRTPQAWTVQEALQQLRLNPDDVYLQYVVMQLAHNEDKMDQASGAIDSLNRQRRRGFGPERRVDLFALFTGALAVQESLQLDTMTGRGNESLAGARDPSRESVKIAELKGPTIKSHPWGKMLAAQQLAGKKPEVSPLAMCVPADQYFILFRSLTKLLKGADAGDVWGAHLLNQATKSAKTQRTSGRLKTQLAVQTDPLTRPFYDMVVEEVAITGNDLYFREGSDVTILFQVKRPEVFRLRMDGFLAAAEKSRPDAVRSTGKIQGVDYVQVATPDRAIHAFSAYPKPTLHVRSNSRVGLERVLRAVGGKSEVQRLGESTEFKYIRTLMVRGDQREDGFIYLSDPFVRRLVGPQLKLTELRRMLCYNHLRMIGHAATLYRTQCGKKPESLERLAEAGCAPAVFGRKKFFCPCGGKYELCADGTKGNCSHHGRAGQLVPCCEIPLSRVTEVEAKEYKQFMESYSRYWRRFFDPIAIRVQLTPQHYRAETIVLPLIDNTVYSGLATALGGEPEPLDALPVPKRNIFSMAVRWNKEALLPVVRKNMDFPIDLGLSGAKEPLRAATVERFLAQGIGSQVGMHVYDASPFVDFNLTSFLGEMLGSFRTGRGGFDDEMIPIGFLVASLNSPVYISIPVKDAQIVDKFLDELDTTLATLARQPQAAGWFEFDFDFYRVPLPDKDERIRCYAVQFGPIKWRLFFARIGRGLYIASKRFILDDLAAMPINAAEKQTDTGPTAHAMVRVRPENWKEVLPAFQLGWAESSRQACLNNLGPLSSVARAVSASGDGQAKSEQVHRRADELHAVHFFCPDGGKYRVSPGGKEVTCSVHGSAAAPRQLAAPAAGSPMGRLIKDFGGVTAELTFLEDGLHAVVTIERK
ncbi:MAG: hypothetical protein ACYSWU_01080 [Planctomycetota bacterium]|jgi:hypothetical protein